MPLKADQSKALRTSAESNGSLPFHRGAVVRITLRNFLTYDHVTVYPGAQLNLVIGPNGTGKSTLVAALVLGLGGHPNVLGRAKYPASFIKEGSKEAFIELELFDPRANHIISRLIQDNNESIWTYQNQSTNATGVKAVVAELNIQVDNLCQILPQEKVQDFVKLDAKGMLDGTEKAVGYTEMYEDHQSLKTEDVDVDKMSATIKTHQDVIQAKSQRIADLQELVDEQVKRRELEAEVKLLKEHREFVVLDMARDEYSKLKHAKNVARQKLRDSEHALSPLKTQRDSCEGQVNAFKLKLDTRSRNLSYARQPLEKLNSRINRAENEVERLKRNQQDMEARENERATREVALREKLCYVSKKIDALEDLGISQDQEIRECDANIAQLSKREGQHQARLQEIEHKLEQLHGRMNGFNSELQRVRSVGHKRLDMLRSRRPDVYKAVMWLRENNGQFQHTVHEPTILLLDVRDVRFAIYVQAAIPNSDMYAFTCESRDDMNAFLQEMQDRQGLRVSCVLSDPAVSLESLRPRFSIDQLRPLGFTHMVSELFDVPDALRRYLYKTHRLNGIPMADVNPDAAQRVINATTGKDIPFFMVGTRSFRSGASRYSAEGWVSAREMGRADNMLSLTLDKDREAALLSNIADAEKQIGTLQTETTAASHEVGDFAGQLENHRQRKKELTAQRHLRLNLEGRRRVVERSLRDCECQACDVASSAAKTAAGVQSELTCLFDFLVKMTDVCRRCQELVLARDVTRVQHDLARRKRSEVERAYNEANAALGNERHDAEQADSACRRQKDEVARLHRDAIRMMQLPDDDDDLLERLKKLFSALPTTLEEIDRSVSQNEALIGVLNTKDDGSLQEYQHLLQERQEITNILNKLKTQLTNLQTNSAIIRDRWMAAAEGIVTELNEHFGSFFAEMGCAGEVKLSRGARNRVSDFGISIYVKFRADEPLCELSATHHSGGERSVATMLYIMALQRLGSTSVPFHCVDEINQGMDAHNERRVFDLVVRAACRRGGAQYFLITPKLLPQLKYPAHGMTVLCVFNSPTMLQHSDWDVDAFCENKLARAAATVAT